MELFGGEGRKDSFDSDFRIFSWPFSNVRLLSHILARPCHKKSRAPKNAAKHGRAPECMLHPQKESGTAASRVGFQVHTPSHHPEVTKGWCASSHPVIVDVLS